MTKMLNKKTNIPLHYKTRKYIETLLHKKREYFLLGNALPSEEQISKELNVSIGTVKKAILDLVNEEVLYRIQGKGTFLATGKAKKEVTILTPIDFSEKKLLPFSYGWLLFNGICNTLHKKEYSILITPFTEEQVEQICEAGIIKTKNIIIINPRRNKNHLHSLHRIAGSTIPFVVAGANIGWDDISYVAVDNKSGIEMALNYLISLGHKNIAYIGNSLESYDGYERFKSFKTLCETKNIPADYIYTLSENSEEWREEIDNILLEWMNNKYKPTAFTTGGYLISLAFIEIIKKYNLKIPDDISFIGFDDLPGLSSFEPPITVIKQPAYEIGVESAKILIEILEGNIKHPVQLVLPTELIIRNSCKTLEERKQ